MYRLYDCRCGACGVTRGQLVDVPSGSRVPRSFGARCDVCEAISIHFVVLSAPAPYMGERVYNPTVSGGAYDTMGRAPVPDLPDLPAGVEATSDNYKQLWSTSEWKEARAEMKEVNRRNARKRERAEAMKRGETINMRRDRCDGDPKITA